MKTLTLSRPTMRYSPKPIEQYGRTIEGKFYGPSESLLIHGDDAAWNLAYLSFDYESRPVSPDSNFTTLVHRTLGMGPIRQWLANPAPQFVALVGEYDGLSQLPLFKAYGHEWIVTMDKRSRKAATHVGQPDDDVDDTEQAAKLLGRFTGKK